MASAICLNKEHPSTPEFSVPIDARNGEWLRSKVNICLWQKEWNRWNMRQFIVKFFAGEEMVKSAMIKIDRLMDQGELREIWIDAKVPPEADTAKVYIWNADSQQEMAIGSLILLQFSEP